MTTTTQTAVDADVPGGFSFLDTAFIGEPTQVIDAVPAAPVIEVEFTSATSRRTWRSRYDAALRAVKAALACVRESATWLFSGVSRDVQRRSYAGRHRVQVTALGRERSTSEFSQAVQLRSREPRTEEGDLVFRPGDTFVDWLTVTHDRLRYVNYARKHLPEHGRWACS